MTRFGQLIGVKPEKFEEYKAYHARVWPEVLETIRRCNIRNYSIFHWQGRPGTGSCRGIMIFHHS